jgi:hypothetical protein
MKNIISIDNILESKEYNGSNPDSLSAWLHVDTSGLESERVEISDQYGNFNWHREKSNNNVRGKSKKGSGEGKGFSFYFARYAYSDKYKLKGSYSTDGYNGFLAVVEFDFIKKYLSDPSVAARLNPKNSVLLVISAESEKSTTIVGATYTKNKRLLNEYIDERFKKTLQIADKLNEKQFDEFKKYKSAIYNGMKKLFIKNMADNIISGTQEFEMLINSNNFII